MYTLYKFHFLNGITEINQLFDDILIIWPAPVYPPIALHQLFFHKKLFFHIIIIIIIFFAILLLNILPYSVLLKHVSS